MHIGIINSNNNNSNHKNTRLEVPWQRNYVTNEGDSGDENEQDNKHVSIQRTKRSNSCASENIPSIRLFLAPQDTEEQTGVSAENNAKIHPNLYAEEGKNPQAGADAMKTLVEEQKRRDKEDRRNSFPDSGSGSRRKASLNIHFFNGSARRLSAVSYAVTQQIQSTIGWKAYVNEEEVQDQTTKLMAKYVWFKLRKSGFYHKNLQTLQTLRSVGNLNDSSEGVPSPSSLAHAFYQIRALAHEIETSHPKVFSSVSKNIGPTAFKSVQTLTKAHAHLASCLFEGVITWTHLVAFFCLTAAICVDSVRSGHQDFVLPLVYSSARVVSKDLSYWISQEGGWESIVKKYRLEDQWMRTFRHVIGFFCFLLFAILVYFIL